ncbi:MAG: CoA transferase [Proteobacteria bacterium]|nr:CoA transferase [Pseudomonadota bacterium]
MDKETFYGRARADTTGPLAGVKVVEATTTWAGPMCSCVLADFGAEVVKVEARGGEIARRSPPFLPGVEPALSFMHATVNRNKRSLTLDLRQDRGREVFRRLARGADVVVENFRPGTMARWGLGYEDLAADHPGLVYVSISGYGQWGPQHERVGYDPLAQAASGFLSLNGSPDGAPVKSPTFLADDLAGLHGALGALAALRHRDLTGEGQHVDVSLLDSLLFQSTGYLTLAAMGVSLPRLGNEFRIAAPANVYACRDGHVMAGVLLDTHWKRMAGILGRPELADDPDYANAPARIERRETVDRLVADWMRGHTVAEVVERFAAEGVPAEAVRSYADSAADPHVQARDMLQPVKDARGQTVPVTGPAAKLSRTPTKVRHAAPDLGADTDAILDELGYDDQARRRLREDGVV